MRRTRTTRAARRCCPARPPARAWSRSSAQPTICCFAGTFRPWPPSRARARSPRASSVWPSMSMAATTSASPATAMGQFQEALQLYSAAPSNQNLGVAAIDAARQVVRTLNDGSDTIQRYRAEIDLEISTAVEELNELLADFDERQQDHHRGNPHRPRRQRRARPARRHAEEDLRDRADLDLHARRQRHGHHHGRWHDAVRDGAA